VRACFIGVFPFVLLQVSMSIKKFARTKIALDWNEYEYNMMAYFIPKLNNYTVGLDI
jgi:hypothetical protein